jgi:O-antigen/teichoic acid export membrane protein
MEPSASTVKMAVPDGLAALANPPAEPRRLAINFFFLSAGEFTAKLLTFASFTYLARALGPSAYGSVEFTLAAMVFFTLPADLGLASYGAREVARHPDRATSLLHEITGLRLALTLCSILALGIFVLVIHKTIEVKILLALYGVSLLAGPFLLQWFFQAHDQMHWVGIASIVRQAGFAGLVFLTCRRGSPLSHIGFIECASVAGVGVFCLYVARHKMGYAWPWPDLHIIRLMGHIREAAPIGLTELAWAFMWYFCTVLLGFIYPDRTLGWFGASHRTLMALHTFVYLYFFNLLPSISRCAALPHKFLLELMDRSIRFGAWTSLFSVTLLTALAPQLLTLMYGPLFRPASHSFSILVWMLPVAMLSGHHRYILIAYNHQRTLLRCTACSAAVTVLLGFALVPFYGGVGAAWALLIALLLNFALVYDAVRRLVAEVPVHRQLAAPLTALAVSVISYLVLARWNVGVALVVGAAVYMAGLVWSDGPRLASFLQTIVKKPPGSTRWMS